MKSHQERLARELFHKLSRSLQNRQPPVELSLEQVDEHWICHTKRNNSACSIDVNDLLFPEQHITFCRDEINWVTGRIPVRYDLVTAVDDWLAGRSVSEMYEHFQLSNGRSGNYYLSGPGYCRRFRIWNKRRLSS